MVGLGLGKNAGPRVLRLLKRPAHVRWCLVSQRGMRPDVIVVVSPEGQCEAGIGKAVEYFLVEALITQAAVDVFNVAVLLRLARVDVVPFDAVLVGLLQDGLAGDCLDPAGSGSVYAANLNALAGVRIAIA